MNSGALGGELRVAVRADTEQSMEVNFHFREGTRSSAGRGLLAI